MSEADDESRPVRRSLLFFAAEQNDEGIMGAYDLYLDALAASDLFDITVMSPNSSAFTERVRERAADLGTAMHPLSDFSRNLLWRAPQLWPILTATRRKRYDIALCHDAFACRGLKQIARRVVGVCHDDLIEGFAAADHVFALTSGSEDFGKQLLPEQVSLSLLPYCYHCTQSERRTLSNERPLCIGTSGSMTKDAALGVFIHMAQLVHQAAPDVRFVLAGSGPMEHELKELADHIAPFVEFTGPMDQADMIKEIDIYCSTAREAPFCLDMCAMMDGGVACVATCTNGAMDILRGGMVGPVVPNDDAFLLAVQLQELLVDRPRIERIGKGCFERIREEDFSPEAFSDQLLVSLDADHQSG